MLTSAQIYTLATPKNRLSLTKLGRIREIGAFCAFQTREIELYCSKRAKHSTVQMALTAYKVTENEKGIRSNCITESGIMEQKELNIIECLFAENRKMATVHPIHSIKR